MIDIKICADDGIKKYLSKCPLVTNNCIFHLNNDREYYDYCVVLYNYPYRDSVICPSENIIYVTGEPENVKKYSDRYLKQFGTVITAQQHIKHRNVVITHQILPSSFTDKTYNELVSMQPFKKERLISIISSNKRFTKEHEYRYQYVKAIKDYFSSEIDLFGNGFQSFENKWDIIAPYKFTVTIENHKSKDYISEKLTDCFLSYTYPLYYGCTNVEDYYPKGSFEWIDISDKEGSFKQINQILSSPNYYEKHISALHNARRCYLEQYDMVPALSSIINKLTTSSKNNRKINVNTIVPPKPVGSDIIFKWNALLSIIKNKLGL